MIHDYIFQKNVAKIRGGEEAGIPKESRVFRTKIELAANKLEHQKKNGIKFDFVAADGYYGNDADFARRIESMGYLYMLDIHSDQEIYLEKPELFLPERKSTWDENQKD